MSNPYNPYNVSEMLIYLNWTLIIIVWSMIIESLFYNRGTKKIQRELEASWKGNNQKYYDLNEEINRRFKFSMIKIKYQMMFSVILIITSLFRIFM